MLGKEHPALGAFRRKKSRPPDWRYMASELAAELTRRMEHSDQEGNCGCNAHMILRVYEGAAFHTVYGDSRVRFPDTEPEGSTPGATPETETP